MEVNILYRTEAAVWPEVLIILQICIVGVSSEIHRHNGRIWSTYSLSLHQDCIEIEKDTQFDFCHLVSIGLHNCSSCDLCPLLWKSQNNFHHIPAFSQLSEMFLFGDEVFHAWSQYQEQSPCSWFKVLGELEEGHFIFKFSFLNNRPEKLQYWELLKNWSWIIIILYRY